MGAGSHRLQIRFFPPDSKGFLPFAYLVVSIWFFRAWLPHPSTTLCMLVPAVTSYWGSLRGCVDAKTLRHTSTSRAPRRGLLAAPPQDSVRPVWWPVRLVSPGSPTKIQRTLAREGPRQGKRTLGCPRLDRPARASSKAMEMREEQHIEIGKEKTKKIKKGLCLIDWIPSIGRNPLYL